MDETEKAFFDLPGAFAAARGEAATALASARLVSKLARESDGIHPAVAEAIRNMAEAVAALSRLGLLCSKDGEPDPIDEQTPG